MNDDTLRYSILLQEFTKDFLHFTWYPRWLPGLNGGFGYPTFVFYQPGFFFFALPFNLLLSSPLTAVYAALYVLFCVSALGAYLLARRVSPPVESLLFTLLYFSGFYVWMNFNTRGDLSELFAMLLSCWPIYGLFQMRDRIAAHRSYRGPAFILALSTFTIITGHPLTALFLLCFMTFFAPLLARPLPPPARKTYLLMVALQLGLALALSSPYWMTLAAMHGLIHNAGLFIFVPSKRLYSLVDIAILAFPHCLAALAGFWLARKKSHYVFCMIAYGVGLFMMTSYSRALWEDISALNFIQFPWRIWSALNVIQYLLILQAARLRHTMPAAAYKALLVGVVTASLACHFLYKPLEIMPTAQLKQELLKADPFLTLTQGDEFNPPGFMRQGLTPENEHAPEVSWLAGHGEFRKMTGSRCLLAYDVNITSPALLTLHQAYFPGWEMQVNKQTIAFNAKADALPAWGLDDHGVMQLSFQLPGRYTLCADYDGPPGWQGRSLFALFSLLVIAAAQIIINRVYSRHRQAKLKSY